MQSGSSSLLITYSFDKWATILEESFIFSLIELAILVESFMFISNPADPFSVVYLLFS